MGRSAICRSPIERTRFTCAGALTATSIPGATSDPNNMFSASLTNPRLTRMPWGGSWWRSITLSLRESSQTATPVTGKLFERGSGEFMSSRDNGNGRLDLVSIRSKLEADTGKRFWRSLEEVAETEEYRRFLNHEFPYGVEKSRSGMNRRDALKLMGASAALAGLTACTKMPVEK